MCNTGKYVVDKILNELKLTTMLRKTGKQTWGTLGKDKYIPLGVTAATTLLPVVGANEVAWGRHFIKYPKTRKYMMATGRKLLHPSKWNK